MRLSNLADYAVVAMTAAARQPAGVRFSAASLSAETQVPLPTMQKLAGKLAAAGLLLSERGARGGLLLARPAAEITLAEIVEAVDGPIALTNCTQGQRHECALDGCCTVRPHWGAVNDALRGVLAEVPLTRLAQMEVSA